MSDSPKHIVRLMTAAKRDLIEAKKSMRLVYGDIQTRRMLMRINDDLKLLETSPYGVPKIEDAVPVAAVLRCNPEGSVPEARLQAKGPAAVVDAVRFCK